MTDIVERLRIESFYSATHGELMREAADEIEKLQERCDGYKGQVKWGADEIERLRADLKMAVWSDSEECKILTAEIERLRALVHKVSSLGAPGF